MATQVSLLDGALASAGTLAIQTNGTTSAITISSAQVATFVNNPIMTGLTASRAVFTDGSKGLTSNAITGTGNVVMSASPTLTGTIDGAALTLSSSLTLSGGTANGVLYLNGSKVATSGSALTFDGTNFATTGNVTGATLKTTRASGAQPEVVLTQTGVASWSIYNPPSSTDLRFYNGSDLVTFASSGNIGIGTTSPDSGISSTQRVLEVANSNVAALTLNNTGARKYTVYSGVAGQLSFYDITGGSERMRITSGGDVGVGTSSPSYKLDVDSTAATVVSLNSTNASGPGLRFTRSGTANGYVGSAKYIVGGALADFGIDVSGANNLIFGTNDVERARLDSSGNLLVGTASAVGGTSLYAGAFAGNSKDGLHLQDTTTTSGTVFAAWVNSSGTIIGSVSRVTTTNAVAYNTTSDVRLKSNVQNALPVLDKLMQIQVRQYDWTDGDLHQEYGFVAQELEPVISGVVTKGKTEEDMWQLDYAKLTPHLVKAIQEQQAIIENLKARLDAANL